MAIPFPEIDPVAVSLGPLEIRWYALAYLAGFLICWRYALALAKKDAARPGPAEVDDFLPWAVLGVILGGRIGYVLFYQFSYYMSDPMEIFKVWHGGMSFHGGMLGLLCAMAVYCVILKIPLLRLTDIVCTVAPVGLFFGRIANFINAELFGRPTDLPWGIVFPTYPDAPRHPSQLYEAALEGILLFGILFALSRISFLRNAPGFLTGAFLVGYGLFRSAVEFFREPDFQIGLIGGIVSMGQILSLPMILGGAALAVYACRTARIRA